MQINEIVARADSTTKIFLATQMHPNITIIFTLLIVLLIGFIGYFVYKNKKKSKK